MKIFFPIVVITAVILWLADAANTVHERDYYKRLAMAQEQEISILRVHLQDVAAREEPHKRLLEQCAAQLSAMALEPYL